jgi:hypothetical protein
VDTGHVSISADTVTNGTDVDTERERAHADSCNDNHCDYADITVTITVAHRPDR